VRAVIVRIQGEGQYRLPDESLDEINRLDDALEAALDAPDGDFRAAFDALLDLIRARGTALDPVELVESDVILPPADVTAEEVRSLLTEEGLIPD
jgi:PspA-Associated protein